MELGESFGLSADSMIDRDLQCQGAGAGGIITSTVFALFILSLLDLSGDKSQHGFRSLLSG